MRIFNKNKKKGFTLVELLAVIVILAIILLIATNVVIPAMNKAKKKALLDEALTYIKASENSYAFDHDEVNQPERTCKTISELNSSYVKKNNSNYAGTVISDFTGNVPTHTISLSDGKYYITGSENLTINDVKSTPPSGYMNSCLGYEAHYFSSDSLAYNMLTRGGTAGAVSSSYDAALNAIKARTLATSFAVSNTSNPGIIELEDDDGTAYYYNGRNTYNNVLFGGKCWKIIGLNGNGSTRIMYSGTPTNNQCPNSVANGAIATDVKYTDTFQPANYARTGYSQTMRVPVNSSNQVSINYLKSLYDISSMGYMVPDYDKYYVYPNYELSNEHKLDDFIPVENIQPTYRASTNSNYIYVFKNFNPETDCGKDQSGVSVCTLKGTMQGSVSPANDMVGLSGDNFLELSYRYGSFNNNDPKAAKVNGVQQGVYNGNFKYTCLSPSTLYTSGVYVYLTCPVVSEIVGGNGVTLIVRNYGYQYYDLTNNDIINAKDSNVKRVVDTWYENNILNQRDGTSDNRLLEDYISDEIFCNDRSLASSAVGGSVSGASYYNSGFYRNATSNPTNIMALKFNAYKRVIEEYKPSLKCVNIKADGFTLGNSQSKVVRSGKGNGKLKYPVGIINADQLLVSGIHGRPSNSGMNQASLYTNTSDMAIMTPALYMTNFFEPYYISGYNKIYNPYNQGNLKVYPVINLSRNVKYDSGNGSVSYPYTVKLSD